AADHFQDVRHIEFDLGDSGLTCVSLSFGRDHVFDCAFSSDTSLATCCLSTREICAPPCWSSLHWLDSSQSLSYSSSLEVQAALLSHSHGISLPRIESQ